MFPFLYIGNLDLLDNACFPRNLFDEFVDFLFVGFRQLVSVFIQYCLQFGAYGDNDMIARLLLFQVDNLLSALQRADIALVDGRIVTEPLCRVTPDQKNVAGNVFVFISRQIECGNSFDSVR